MKYWKSMDLVKRIVNMDVPLFVIVNIGNYGHKKYALDINCTALYWWLVNCTNKALNIYYKIICFSYRSLSPADLNQARACFVLTSQHRTHSTRLITQKGKEGHRENANMHLDPEWLDAGPEWNMRVKVSLAMWTMRPVQQFCKKMLGSLPHANGIQILYLLPLLHYGIWQSKITKQQQQSYAVKSQPIHGNRRTMVFPRQGAMPSSA